MRSFVATQLLSGGSGGISRVARLTVRALSESGHSIEAIANHEDSRDIHLPVPVQAFFGSRLFFFLACQFASLKCSRIVYDFAGTARASWGAPFVGRPYMVWIHGLEVWEGLRTPRRAKIRHAAMIIANSHFTRNRAIELHGEMFERTQVCWLGTLEDEPGEISPERDSGAPVVLVVARMENGRDKGHAAMIDAWPQVVAAAPGARLIIVGDGSGRDELIQRAERSAAVSDIEFAGFVTESKLDKLYARANVFAMPSRGEGFGLVYVEAMRHAAPVIASVHDAGQEVNVDGVTGYNVSLDRPGELAGRLIELITNRELAVWMGQNGLTRWRENFAYGKFRQRFTPLFEEFAKTKTSFFRFL